MNISYFFRFRKYCETAVGTESLKKLSYAIRLHIAQEFFCFGKNAMEIENCLFTFSVYTLLLLVQLLAGRESKRDRERSVEQPFSSSLLFI